MIVFFSLSISYKPTTVETMGLYEYVTILLSKNFLTIKNVLPIDGLTICSTTTKSLFCNIKQLSFIFEISIVSFLLFITIF